MIVRDLTTQTIYQKLKQDDFGLAIGPFNVALSSSFHQVGDAVHQLYTDYELLDANQFIDFPVKVAPPSGIRRWYRPQAVFSFNDFKPASAARRSGLRHSKSEGSPGGTGVRFLK